MAQFDITPVSPLANFHNFENVASKKFELVKKAKTIIITEAYIWNEKITDLNRSDELPTNKFKVYYNDNGLVEFIEVLKDINLHHAGNELEFFCHYTDVRPNRQKCSFLNYESHYHGGTNYYYNNDNQLFKIVRDLYFDNIHYESYEMVFFYKDSCINWTVGNQLGNHEYEIVLKDNLKLLESTRYSFGYEEKMKFIYDSKNRISIIETFSNEREDYDTDESIRLGSIEMQSIQTYNYTEKPHGEIQITINTQNILDNEVTKKEIVTDSNSNILFIYFYNIKGKQSYFLEYDYIFDEFYNWIDLKIFLKHIYEPVKKKLMNHFRRDFQY